MKYKLTIRSLLHLALFLTLAPIALASTTWYVNGVNGSDTNNCKSHTTACKTIGHAILLAASGDTVMVAAATYKENLTIGFSLSILGAGAATTIVDGGGAGTVFTISSGTAKVTLSNFTIRNGNGSAGGVVNDGLLTINSSTVNGNVGYHGAGISNNGTLRIHHSTIGNNYTVGFLSFGGGGVVNGGTVTISDSTISGNGARVGGGIYNSGTLVINNSTLSGNQAVRDCNQLFCNGGGRGGAVYNVGGHLTINNSTISGNKATGICTFFPPSCVGGGIFNAANATIQNSIVANNVANDSGGNCYGTMISNGYNMSSDDTCNLSNSGDRLADPKLGTLGNYGGPTRTIPLLSGSPAIDAGNPSGCTDGQGHLLKTDQRGQPRPDKEDKAGCDMGAYERQSD